MPTQIVTTDDLRELKIELLEDFKRLLKEHGGSHQKNGSNRQKFANF